MPLPDAVRRIPLDDKLSALTPLLADARVVGIGENNHHVREFGTLRDRIVRFLVTELGFRVIAFESGFTEGYLVDAWLQGRECDIDAVARDGFTFRFGDAAQVREMLAWLRAHNGTHNAGDGRVRFAGVDVPASGGSGLPALRRVREYVAAHDPDGLSLVDAAVEASTVRRGEQRSRAQSLRRTQRHPAGRRYGGPVPRAAAPRRARLRP